MQASSWYWLMATDAGLLTRIAAGACVFAVLAVWDVRRRGKEARRWREYLFLLVAVAAAMAYGVAIDQITATISWEYFVHGKGLSAFESHGPAGAGEAAAFRWEVAKLGAKAAWTAGLILGAAVLIANNPRPQRPPLPFAALYRMLPRVAACAAVLAAALGLAGYLGLLTWTNSDFGLLFEENLYRPQRFLCAWGIHLGSYVGAAAGAALAVWRVLRRHRRTAANSPKYPPDA